MTGMKLSKRDTVMIVILALIIIGTVYYMAFYTPMQNDMLDIEIQTSEIDAQISTAQEKVLSMNDMQAELDEIFSRPKDEITEIAPYDNAKSVMNFLNGILSRSTKYTLSFSDPSIEDSGTVRRSVSLSFSCADYATAKSILKDLARWNYRCLLGSVSISPNDDGGIALEEEDNGANANAAEADADIDGRISVNASMTFFESLNLT